MPSFVITAVSLFTRRFAEARRVDRVVAEVRGLGGKRRTVSSGVSGAKDGGPDPRQVSMLLAAHAPRA